MSDRYKNLLSPIQVRGVLLKNRMVSTAGIPHMLQGTENYPTEKLITHMGNRAKSGAAAVYLNFGLNVSDDKTDPQKVPQRGIDMNFPPHDTAVDHASTASHAYICQMIDMVRYYGSVAINMPSAHYTRNKEPGAGPNYDFDKSDPMKWLRQEQEHHFEDFSKLTKAQMRENIDTAVQSALLLKQFGYEMFSFHNAYHGGLTGQLWSEDSNNRTDEYGGSPKNRARYFLEFYDAIRQTMGRDFPIEVLVSAEGPGVSVKDTIELAKMCEGLIDVLHIRAGEKDPQHPVGFTSTRENPSPNLAAAAAIKESIMARGGKLLVGVSAGLHDPDLNERIITENKADIICMCRTWISEPEYITKLKEGRGEDVTPCIRCNKCHVPNDSDKFRSFCSVNPKLEIEFKADRMASPVTGKKKIAIVGGGPAGMKCAITCAQRGHDVTLYEKGRSLGGQLFHADYASFKWPVADLKDWLIRQTYKNGVNVILNTAATKELLQKEGFDEVVVAIGPKFKMPNIQGIDGKNVISAIDVYGHEKELPHEIVVIGGSETGTETGMYLAESGHHVTVMTRQAMLSNDAAHAHYVVMLMDAYLALDGFDYVRWVQKYESITDEGVTYIDKDGTRQFIPCDLVVAAGGVEPQPEKCGEFYGAAKLGTYYIGDCYRAGDIHKAISAGYATGSQL